jgi:DNA-binding LytR/AlgR family response regulator
MSTLPAHPTALIAEDEPLLAAALQAELARAWPDLQLLACVADGGAAVHQALTLQPDVLFFDIRMPGIGGLEAAAELAERWDSMVKPFPALVFVTAYDQYALQAFEAQAMDYLLKPVHPARLHKTVAKLQDTLALRSRSEHPLQAGQAADAHDSRRHHGTTAPVVAADRTARAWPRWHMAQAASGWRGQQRAAVAG